MRRQGVDARKQLSRSECVKKLKWKEVLPGVRIPVAENRHWYYRDIGLALVPLWFGLMLDPFGLLYYVSGWIKVPLFSGLHMSILFVPLLPICLLWLLMRMVRVWPRRVYPRWRLLGLWLLVVLALAILFVLPFSGLSPARGPMFLRGLRQHMRAKADIPAIRAWLQTLDSGNPESAPERLPAIVRLAPKGIAVSVDETGRPMLRLTWGSGIIGSWGLVVGDERTPVAKDTMARADDFELLRASECRMALAPGAYVWYDFE